MIDLRQKDISNSDININTRLIIMHPSVSILRKIEKWGNENLAEKTQKSLYWFLTGRDSITLKTPITFCFKAKEKGKVWLCDVIVMGWCNNYGLETSKEVKTKLSLVVSAVSYLGEGDI